MARILIVDDEAEIRDSLQELFELEGYAVATAANGAQALALLERDEHPCVVLLDLMMPVMDGGELVGRMRGDPALAEIPVIVVTSDASRAPEGVTAMKKPVALDRLLREVRARCTPSA